jgi:hypothetical protein
MMKQKYTDIRERAQLAGIIPTTPEGALKSEVVDPATQTNNPLPSVVREGLKGNWATPDAAKPAILSALLEPFFVKDVVLDAQGNRVEVAPDRALQIQCAKLLRDLDQTQFERDNPEAAGQAKGGLALSVQTNIEAARLIRESFANGLEIGEGAFSTPSESGAFGSGGLEGEVESSASFAEDKFGIVESLEDSEL